MTTHQTPVWDAPGEYQAGRVWIDPGAGVRISYRRFCPEARAAGIGAHPTVLLVHGAPQTGYAWRKVVAPLVEAGYQVVVPDYRGAGASSKSRDGYDKWTMAGDLHHLLHEELQIVGPVSVVGHDLGSMLALAYALRYRDDVVSLTTMEAPLPGTDYYEQRKVAKTAWHFDFHAHPAIAVHLTHGQERWYVQRSYDDLTYRPDAITTADVDEYARAFEAPGAMRALCEIYRELDHDAQIHRNDIAAHGKLTIPVLASGGGAQKLAANYLPMCQEIAHDVTGYLVPDCGHWVAEENPSDFVRMFLDFDHDARSRNTHPQH